MEIVQSSKSPHPLIWVAAIALIVFCAAGVAAVMGWIPTSLGKTEEPLVKVEKPKSAPAKVAAAQPAKVAPVAVAAARCAECGFVQSIREIETKGEGSGIGVVGGAVAGGVVGNQFGHGNGNKIMTVVGAVGGAVAGNEIEKRVRSTKSYEITVRMEDGSNRVVHQATAPTWREGDKVKLVNGALQSNA
jgi:outer membrane lipoprotein SlyB